MRMQGLATSVLVVALWGCGAGVCRAQEPVVGTPAASMANPNAVRIALRVTADGDFTWKLDGVEQGLITAAMGIKEVMTTPARHEITAKGPDGKTHFDQIVTVAPEKQNLVRITTRAGHGVTAPAAAAAMPPTPSPRTSAKSQPAASEMPTAGRGSYPNPYAGNPDMFVRVIPQVYPYATASWVGGRKTARAAGSQITVIATPVTLGGTYYDIKVQMVMKGVGSAESTIELPDLLPGSMPNTFTAITEQMGKEAVICYTAHAASQPAQRWTGAFTIQNGATPGVVAFVPAREPTLEKASDAPCGGLKAIKVAATPAPEAAASPERPKPDWSSADASLALARGSQLYNARRYAEARPLLITACEGGTGADACNSVGFMYQYNLGVATDYAKAREYYLKSCNDDSSFSCANLGTLYRDGQGVPRDPQRALQFFEQGCDAGVPEGCHAAGRMLLDHNGVPQDNAHALEFFKKACDENVAGACGDEAFIYAMGLGVPKDLAFAASLFKRACGMGSRNSCFSMGEMYRSGDGVPRDPAKSREYYSKACDMGDQDSCGMAR
ncbi:MAG: tetratricopeptide repeat protein [Candidatus Korobacteraceae bacterium]